MFVSDPLLSHLEAVTDAPDLSGTRYEAVELLDRGGMGSVWLARDRELNREVAVKVAALPLSGEAQVIAQLEHPGIVPVHDTGTLPDGRVFYVMKWVRGERLDVWAAPRALRVRLRLFQRICETMAFAHSRGVLHCDLKPQNVMVGPFGEALIIDWGLATPTAGVVEQPRTVVGTPAYMAPEAARGEPVSTATDLYGLGALLHALISGRAPFSGTSAQEIIARVAQAEPPERLEAPPALAAVVAKAMAREPRQRYATALELRDDVGRWLDQAPVVAYREPLFEKLMRFASRNSVVLSLLGMYLLLRLVLLAFTR